MDRRLAAILAADVVGYTRLMGEDEAGTLAALKAHRQDFIDPTVAKHGGRIVKLMGDGALVEFASAVSAVACAAELQQGMAARNADVSEDRRTTLRIGINLGDVIIDGDDLYGDGVNIAARIEGLAAPGGICVSGKVHEEVRNRLDLAFEDLGPQEVKNVAEPIRVYRVVTGAAPAPQPPALQRTLSLPDTPSIAVLPFENLSGDAEQEYFADGVAEDILTALSRLPDLFVIDRHSSFTYKGKTVSCQQVGAELGVRYVLEGSVRRSGNRARITAQLIDAASGKHVWAERYDRELTDIFAVQDEITRNIVIEMQGKLAYGEYAQRWQRDTENFEAWDCVLRCFPQFFRFTQDGFEACIRLSEKAVALDPNFGSAYAVMGWSYSALARYFSDDPEPLLAKALACAEKAVAFQGSRGFGLNLIGQQKLREHRHDEAVALAKEAISLAPNAAENHFMLGRVLLFSGQAEEAIAQTEQAMRLSPLWPAYFLFNLVEGHRLLGDLERALEWARLMAERMPESYLPHMYTAGVLGLMGRGDEARAAARKVVALHPAVTLTAYAALSPYKDPAHLAPLIEALRQTGLPE